jgi:hypothetical protein
VGVLSIVASLNSKFEFRSYHIMMYELLVLHTSCLYYYDFFVIPFSTINYYVCIVEESSRERAWILSDVLGYTHKYRRYNDQKPTRCLLQVVPTLSTQPKP